MIHLLLLLLCSLDAWALCEGFRSAVFILELQIELQRSDLLKLI